VAFSKEIIGLGKKLKLLVKKDEIKAFCNYCDKVY
jgi:hypothetical protein